MDFETLPAARSDQEKVHRLVITGAPCSGKSTAVKQIQIDFQNQLRTVPEAATFLIGGTGFNVYQHAPKAVTEFERTIFELQQNLEKFTALQASREGKNLIVCETGIIDNACYLEGGIASFEANYGRSIRQERENYDQVIFLQSPGMEVIKSVFGQNPSRLFEMEEISRTYGPLSLEIWREHPNFVLVQSNETWEQKYQQISQKVQEFLKKIST